MYDIKTLPDKPTFLFQSVLFGQPQHAMSFKSLDDYTKADWLARNTHGPITPDTIIYRVFRVDYLQNDLDSDVLTLVNPCYETQQDDLENPLKEATFNVEGRSHNLFRRLMSEYYTQSWSLTEPTWGVFGQGHDTVRVACNAAALFDRLYDADDPFASLYYHMAIVSYLPSYSINDSMNNSHFESFLDSQGLGLLRTVTTIRSDFSSEDEVRLVYVRSPRDDYSHPLRHKVLGTEQELCAHLFDWNGIIRDHSLCPTNTDAASGQRLANTIFKKAHP
jgi:hypothetical protein